MRLFLFCSFCILLLVSCKKEPDTPVAKPQKFDNAAYADSLKNEREKPISNKSKDSAPKTDSSRLKINPDEIQDKADTLFVKIHNGKARVDAVKLPRQKLVFVLDSDTARKLKLKITPQDSAANIRISQIIDSKDNSDGPFGRETEYPIIEKGIQNIIVSESLMQGDPWGGQLVFEVKLGW